MNRFSGGILALCGKVIYPSQGKSSSPFYLTVSPQGASPCLQLARLVEVCHQIIIGALLLLQGSPLPISKLPGGSWEV